MPGVPLVDFANARRGLDLLLENGPLEDDDESPSPPPPRPLTFAEASDTLRAAAEQHVPLDAYGPLQTRRQRHQLPPGYLDYLLEGEATP